MPAPAQPAPPASGFSWWWLAGAALVGALVGALGIVLAILRARGREAQSPEAIEPPTADEAPRGPPLPVRPAAGPVPPLPDQSPIPAPIPAPAPDSAGLDLALEPVRLSLSLVNATLHYRLRLTNGSGSALGPVVLAADMIAAHASLPEDSLLARDGAALEPRHQLPGLAPGESAEFGGELRLPLAAITPIRSGSAALLVPLVRVRIESDGICVIRALVVGEAPARPGGLLRPFRLDHGPRIFSAVSQRELAA